MKKDNLYFYGLIFVLILLALLSIFLVEDRQLVEVETYSVGMEVIEKTILQPENAKIFSLEGSGEQVRKEVSDLNYARYNTGEILEVLITVKETKFTHIQFKFYTILGRCGE